MSKRLEIRGSWKQLAAGKLAASVVGLLGMTLRYRVEDPHETRQVVGPGIPGVWVFWHGNLLTAPLALSRFLGKIPASTLTSASKDGAVIASFLSCFGVKSVRGSSSRRAVASLIALKRALKQNDQVFVTPDGPRGPRYVMEPGVVKLAQSASCPLYPVRFSYSSSWRLKTWDRLHIPKPFSRVTIHIEAPCHIPAKLDENDFESVRQGVESSLHEGIDDFPETSSK
ncbi:lysophospholipid acyltransferase family protein [Verrucomicrobiaceae bacterium N1E253]|uniref:Lysophospholipid acyltransferase family protein n=1 Tax=Oceaniferula marina TaxID=2748318 RepID=A0A851GBM5_9BACT|nr:lysophospholipid acyltransferase family protein [Oceaniferula marina]NWK54342.1 lysophospholipid acyltransferase family protein [Oceaniferula marina]